MQGKNTVGHSLCHRLAAFLAFAFCKSCKVKIGKGEMRVGFTVYPMGHKSTVFSHPNCFFNLWKIEIAPNTRMGCKMANCEHGKVDISSRLFNAFVAFFF